MKITRSNNGKTLKGNFYANEIKPGYNYIDYESNIVDHFTI